MDKFRKMKKHKKTRKIYIKRAGSQLPRASSQIIELPPLYALENIYKNKKAISKQKGGLLSDTYVGPTWGNLVVSNFPISADNILLFKKLSTGPYMDCVISALQIIGILDFFTANVFRITKIGTTFGLDLNEIELIFTLRTNKRFLFLSTTDINEFIQNVNMYLQPGNVIFCGVDYLPNYNFTITQKHVFLIGKNLNGRIIKIDPNARNPFCFLDTDRNCLNDFEINIIKFYLLFNYTGELTQAEAEAIGITYNPTFQYINDANNNTNTNS